ncbi:MAG: 50S ribosomal protein L24 [Candidatus Buchananbacteria bacterium RIFCSPLOWO2_01_FULL_46_12]|uniref:Large ribosomal subunit protein uL24 n=2 Tax=Candidatus Buchananiibacteriota TaxID=1817903 RepID=A0A1G1YR53_9BACT|nr:MAG: 50S ribosomal protein L24 [Candidatus Buchananbacteria bacterium RIFCSPHIGHO2_01_FULL_44_11]OGY54838.1 MAG: 50S ribosomal protein L24 [Candidatus Buchananbacteria bacterium RIFCSPLOWO2_01_FULL_46_12]
MRIKKGDKVKVLAGKDKGKTGKVLQVFLERQRVSVEGVNLLFKNMRPRKQGERGQRIQFPAPIIAANVALVCPKCGQVTRIGRQLAEGKKKVRICRKCKSVID